jgi:hypothetical protein
MESKPKGEESGFNPNYTFAGKNRDIDTENCFMARLILDSFEPLERLNQNDRGVCPKCKNSRKFFCYDCMVPLNDRSEVPLLQLPVDVTIIRHPKEKKSKSSVIPSKVLAPDNVEILHTIDVPDQLTEKYLDGLS